MEPGTLTPAQSQHWRGKRQEAAANPVCTARAPEQDLVSKVNK